MQIIKNQLKVTINRMVHISRYFLGCNITPTSSENFTRVIKEGLELNNYLKRLTVFEEEIKRRIENYLIACEETIFAAGMELENDYCEVREVLEDFRDERLLVMRFLNGNLDDSMFI
jgi:hypothetical protein